MIRLLPSRRDIEPLVWAAIVIVAGFEVFASYLALHPDVSPVYRDYYITKTKLCTPRRADFNALDLGREFVIGADETGHYLGDGWCSVEAWGVWSEGGTSFLTATVPPPDGDLLFTARVSPSTVGLPAQDIRLYVNDTEVGAWDLPPGGKQDIRATLPHAAVKDGRLLLRFEIGHPASVGAADKRRIGLGLISFSIRPVGGEQELLPAGSQ
jgi:hypothetical protein